MRTALLLILMLFATVSFAGNAICVEAETAYDSRTNCSLVFEETSAEDWQRFFNMFAVYLDNPELAKSSEEKEFLKKLEEVLEAYEKLDRKLYPRR